jgi:hypothetical protein
MKCMGRGQIKKNAKQLYFFAPLLFPPTYKGGGERGQIKKKEGGAALAYLSPNNTC